MTKNVGRFLSVALMVLCFNVALFAQGSQPDADTAKAQYLTQLGLLEDCLQDGGPSDGMGVQAVLDGSGHMILDVTIPTLPTIPATGISGQTRSQLNSILGQLTTCRNLMIADKNNFASYAQQGQDAAASAQMYYDTGNYTMAKSKWNMATSFVNNAVTADYLYASQQTQYAGYLADFNALLP